jgi:hypothetical protein
MADPASNPTDPADETLDAVATDPITAALDGGDGNLLGELARAMHAAATSQYERLNIELERRRAEQVEAIAQRANAESETLKADSETDIGSIDAWAKTETEKIKLERLRRIDGRREELAAQLVRQETIKEREVFAIEVAIDAHRNEVDLFFGRMERETDPSAIATIASTMPPFPSLEDVAVQARRSAAAEFATIDGVVEEPTPRVDATPGTAETTGSTAKAESHESADATTAHATAETGTESATETELEAAAVVVSESRLKAVMDPKASRDEGTTTQPWEAPFAVSVAAGSGPAEEEPPPVSVGSTLLRTVRSIRPMAGRHDKDSGDSGSR